MAEILRKSDAFHAESPHPPVILRSGKPLWTVAQILILSPVLLAGSANLATPEARLENAIRHEMVLGDLKGAMEQYKSLLAEPAQSRPLAARALLRMAECQEKLGRHAEAYDTFTEVAKEYRDQTAIAEIARVRLENWESAIPAPLNLKFTDGNLGKLPGAWFVPTVPQDSGHWAQLRRDGCRQGDQCAVVLVPENAPSRVGNLMQAFSAKAYRGKTVRYAAWIRLEAAGSDDRAQIWLSVDRPNDRKGFFENMSDRPVRSGGWTLCEIRGRIDEDATFIKFGVMSLGRGRVWVDDVSFEIIP